MILQGVVILNYWLTKMPDRFIFLAVVVSCWIHVRLEESRFLYNNLQTCANVTFLQVSCIKTNRKSLFVWALKSYTLLWKLKYWSSYTIIYALPYNKDYLNTRPHFDVAATSWRCSKVVSTLNWRYMPDVNELNGQ